MTLQICPKSSTESNSVFSNKLLALSQPGILTPDSLQGLTLWEEFLTVADGPFTELARRHLNRWLVNRLVTDLVNVTRQRIVEWGINSVEAERLDDQARLFGPSVSVRPDSSHLARPARHHGCDYYCCYAVHGRCAQKHTRESKTRRQCGSNHRCNGIRG